MYFFFSYSVCAFAGSLLLFSVSVNRFRNILSPLGEWLRAFERPSALSPQHTISLPTRTHTQNMGGHATDTLHKPCNIQVSKTHIKYTHSSTLFEGLPTGSQLQLECVTGLLTGQFWSWSAFHHQSPPSLCLFPVCLSLDFSNNLLPVSFSSLCWVPASNCELWCLITLSVSNIRL